MVQVFLEVFDLSLYDGIQALKESIGGNQRKISA